MIHYSVCIRSKWKFPLLQNDEYEIGPCYTEVAYRGKRIYSKVLSTIIQVEAPLSPVMLINRDNTSSIKGVECIGFEKIGNAWRTKLLKRYRSVNDSEL